MESYMDSKDFLVKCKSENMILILNVKDTFSKIPCIMPLWSELDMYKLDSDGRATIFDQTLHITRYLLTRSYQNCW